ncbi:MAG TPA: gamma carbonic anhydrase family protein, partial [Methanolinea sp.]|nr:gamma carbonic anhydrase family protein [Methanolinea sp.]
MDIDRAQFRDAFIADNATILGDVTIGRKVSIWYGAVIRADKDSVALGDWSNVQDNAVLHTSAGYPVQVGREVSIGHGAILHGCTIRD